MTARCESCGCWLTPICNGADTTCSNERCPSSWQSAKRAFDSSLLGAACRQLVGAGASPRTERVRERSSEEDA